MTGTPVFMGIVNASGDSFSEGEASGSGSAVSRAQEMLDHGFRLLDLGAESTRPGAEAVDPELEQSRLLPVVKTLRRKYPDAVLSIDTRNAATAEAALRAGSDWINDVSMLRHDPAMIECAAKHQATLVLCHSRGTPQNMCDAGYHDYGSDICQTVMTELHEAAEQAISGGIAPGKIIYDPGFGFGKTPEQQLTMLRELKRFKSLGRLLIGVSRKSFLGRLCQEPDPAKRKSATLAAELWAIKEGAEIIRTHEPAALRQAWMVYRSLQ